jgi:hypothetical protein
LQPLMNTNAGNANAATISNRLLMYRPFRMSVMTTRFVHNERRSGWLGR